MLKKRTRLLLTAFLASSIAGVSACEQKSKVSVGEAIVIVQSNGCVAYLWADTSKRWYSADVMMARAEKHITGEIEPSQINTPLMIAIVRNQHETVLDLLSSGVDADETNQMGCTALIWAAALGRDAIVSALLDASANTASTDAAGRTPLMFASLRGNANIVKELIMAGAEASTTQTGGSNEVNRTALHYAARRSDDNSEIIKLLIANGADVNVARQHGWTPLLVASRYGSIENVKALVEAGAELKHETSNGLSAIDLAKNNNPDNGIIAEYLNSIK